MTNFSISKALRDEAQHRGVLTPYDFSGEIVYGTDRNDAISQLMKTVFARVFTLLKTEFGATARFQPRPALGNGHPARPDFWWRKASFGIRLTGPYHYQMSDDGTNLRNDRSSPLRMLAKDFPFPGNPDIIRIPYHIPLQTPRKFLQQIRERLIASGAYPRLTSK